MRYLGYFLIVCLLRAPGAHALEVYGDLLYWRATEPVDWVLNTNRSPTDQYVAYETVAFDFAPGFRIGYSHDQPWHTAGAFSHYRTHSVASASGNLTPTFLGGKLALSDDPASSPPYFAQGQVDATIDYKVLDWDLGAFCWAHPSLRLRPLLGLKAAWISQTFDSMFEDVRTNPAASKCVMERIQNDFWGLGPKVGIDGLWNVWCGDECQLSCVAGFQTAYLLGHWAIDDVTDLHSTVNSQTTTSRRIVPIRSRDFGAVTFQVMVGVELTYRRWSGLVGYEINDWLNQCQIFDDATGPHNNDLILQGLSVVVSRTF